MPCRDVREAQVEGKHHLRARRAGQAAGAGGGGGRGRARSMTPVTKPVAKQTGGSCVSSLIRGGGGGGGGGGGPRRLGGSRSRTCVWGATPPAPRGPAPAAPPSPTRPPAPTGTVCARHTTLAVSRPRRTKRAALRRGAGAGGAPDGVEGNVLRTKQGGDLRLILHMSQPMKRTVGSWRFAPSSRSISAARASPAAPRRRALSRPRSLQGAEAGRGALGDLTHNTLGHLTHNTACWRRGDQHHGASS